MFSGTSGLYIGTSPLLATHVASCLPNTLDRKHVPAKMQQTHPLKLPHCQSGPSQMMPWKSQQGRGGGRWVNFTVWSPWDLWHLPLGMAHHREGEICNPGAGEVKLGPYALNPKEAEATIASPSLHGAIFLLPALRTNFGSLVSQVPIIYVQGPWHPEPLSFSSRHGLVHTKEVNQCYTSVSLKFMELFGSKTKKNKTD